MQCIGMSFESGNVYECNDIGLLFVRVVLRDFLTWKCIHCCISRRVTPTSPARAHGEVGDAAVCDLCIPAVHCYTTHTGRIGTTIKPFVLWLCFHTRFAPSKPTRSWYDIHLNSVVGRLTESSKKIGFLIKLVGLCPRQPLRGARALRGRACHSATSPLSTHILFFA